MAKRWCLYLAGLLGCMIFYLANQLWLSWVLMHAVMCLPWLSLLFSLPGMLTTRLKAVCSGKTALGSQETVLVKIRCPFPVPYFRCRLAVERVTTGERWTLEPKEPLPTNHCGKMICRIKKSRVYDFLGLFFLPVRKSGKVAVVVMPKPVEMSAPAELERQMSQSWQVKPGGGFAENHELRLYRPGDSLRQIHWKLSAKTGKLVIREAMEPRGGRLLLTMDILGTAEELDQKFGQLLWLGQYLLERGFRFDILARSGRGVAEHRVETETDFFAAMEALLSLPPVTDGTVLDRELRSTWHFHIGGGADER